MPLGNEDKIKLTHYYTLKDKNAICFKNIWHTALYKAKCSQIHTVLTHLQLYPWWGQVMSHTELVWVQYKENLSFNVLARGRWSVDVLGAELCIAFVDGEHVCQSPSPSLCSTRIRKWSVRSSRPVSRLGPAGQEWMPLHALPFGLRSFLCKWDCHASQSLW